MEIFLHPTTTDREHELYKPYRKGATMKKIKTMTDTEALDYIENHRVKISYNIFMKQFVLIKTDVVFGGGEYTFYADNIRDLIKQAKESTNE